MFFKHNYEYNCVGRKIRKVAAMTMTMTIHEPSRGTHGSGGQAQGIEENNEMVERINSPPIRNTYTFIYGINGLPI